MPPWTCDQQPGGASGSLIDAGELRSLAAGGGRGMGATSGGSAGGLVALFSRLEEPQGAPGIRGRNEDVHMIGIITLEDVIEKLIQDREGVIPDVEAEEGPFSGYSRLCELGKENIEDESDILDRSITQRSTSASSYVLF